MMNLFFLPSTKILVLAMQCNMLYYWCAGTSYNENATLPIHFQNARPFAAHFVA